MTLIVGLRGRDGLVLASDSRGTIGDPRGLTAINDTQVKQFQLSNYCAIGIAGSSELAAKFVDELRTKVTGGEHESADAILRETRRLVRANYDDWFGKFPPKERPSVHLMLVGYNVLAKQKPVARIYLLGSPLDFAPQLFEGNCLLGVPQYATYLMHRLYQPEMEVVHLVRLAVYLITETATQDPKVGGPVRVAAIKPKEGYVQRQPEEVQSIIEENAVQNEKLKDFFFKRRQTKKTRNRKRGSA